MKREQGGDTGGESKILDGENKDEDDSGGD